MTDLKEQFEMVLRKYFHKRVKDNIAIKHDNGWRYKNNCIVAFSYDDCVECYFELDEKHIMAENFDTSSDNKIRVTTPKDLEVAIQKFLKNEKKLVKKHRLKMIKEL